MKPPFLALIESNTTGTGRLFARRAAEMGIVPVLFASSAARYPYAAEDGIETIETDTTRRKVLYAAIRQRMQGAELAGVASSSELYCALAAALALDFNRPGPDPVSVGACRDKGVQRHVLHTAGVGVPKFHVISSVEQAVRAAERLGGQAVVKPVMGTGSAGVRLCCGAADVAAHAAELLSHTVNERGLRLPRRILIEQVVYGPEFSVEAFGGSVIGVTAKHLGDPPYFVETGHDFPAPISAAVTRSLCMAVSEALQALGVTWGATHTELRWTTAGPCVMEVNPRLAGGCIPELVRHATGIDLVNACVQLGVGRPAALGHTKAGAASIRFLLPEHEGILLGASGIDRVGAMPGVVEAVLYRRPGDVIRLRGDFRDRIGHVIVAGAEGATVRATAQRTCEAVGLRIASAEVT
jgi:biotin carboxylase